MCFVDIFIGSSRHIRSLVSLLNGKLLRHLFFTFIIHCHFFGTVTYPFNTNAGDNFFPGKILLQIFIYCVIVHVPLWGGMTKKTDYTEILPEWDMKKYIPDYSTENKCPDNSV